LNAIAFQLRDALDASQQPLPDLIFARGELVHATRRLLSALVVKLSAERNATDQLPSTACAFDLDSTQTPSSHRHPAVLKQENPVTC
jgi:hypothetical protein